MRRVGQPIGAVGDVGPAARSRDAPRQRLDVTRDIVEAGNFGGKPFVRDMTLAFAEITPQPRDEAGMRIDPELAEIGHAARRP
ncbi:hypothetical protein D9M73_127670 [compost metagenome]